MRRFDKTKNLQKANLLAEQRYLKSKGFITENIIDESELYEAERTSMSEFFGDVTDNVDTLLKMFSKYKPNNSWFMTVGYVNNVNISVRIKNEELAKIEEMARQLNSPIFNHMIDSVDFSTAKEKGKLYNNPYAKRTQKGVEIPSRVYSTKNFTIQWGNIRSKSDKDAAVKSVYDKHGVEWPEGGEIDVNDKRGRGWEQIPGTPFAQHQDTGTKRLAIYGKKESIKSGRSKFFLNFEGEVKELTPEETNFLFNVLDTTSRESKMPYRLLSMENQEAAQEIFAVEELYSFKNLDLDKISYIRCAMQVDGENKKFSYLNKNVVPAGLTPGAFAEIIKPD
jgi:hypothetical protein